MPLPPYPLSLFIVNLFQIPASNKSKPTKKEVRMKKTLSITAAAVTILFAGSALAAGIHDPGINKRQRHQQRRILQGVKSGELTRRETIRLEKEQARIARKEHRFKSDGVLTKRERAILHRDLNRSSRHIYRQKHDGQRKN
jgi:hypothetical protein